MKRPLALRLIVDLGMTMLLLIGFSYYWLGNTVHELVGTGFFLLLFIHNIFNRRWYRTLKRPAPDLIEILNRFVTFALIAVMSVIFISSVLISKFQYDLIGINGGFKLREIHIAASYWAIIIVSVHLGLRWKFLVSIFKNFLGISHSSKLLSIFSKVLSIAIAIQGLRSSYVLGIGGKLTMNMTLDWWNFDESAFLFFVHCMAVSGLYIVATYYSLSLFSALKSKRIIQ